MATVKEQMAAMAAENREECLILWQCERKNLKDFPDRECGKLAHNLLTQINEMAEISGHTMKKTRIVVNREILQSLKPLLSEARVETFIDWFYDTPHNELLNQGPWLLRREWFDADKKTSTWKLRVMVTPNSDDTLQWVECQTEATIVRRLKESDIDIDSLPGRYHHIYLDIYTKRYHLDVGLWIDFVGWYPYNDLANAAVYAICTAEQPLASSAQSLFDNIKSRSTSTGFAPSKTLVMLAHDKPELFSEIFKSDRSTLFEFVHSGAAFVDFDYYLGQEQAWKNFTVSDDEEDDELSTNDESL